MSYDLLERWPRQNSWNRYLIEFEKELLRPWAEKLPHLAVFFLRSDLLDNGIEEAVYSLLERKFSILHIEGLSEAQQQRDAYGSRW